MDSMTFLRTTLANAAKAIEAAQYDTARKQIALAREVLAGDIYLTTGEVAAKLGVKSITTVKALVKAGKLDAARDGERTHLRIPLASVLAYMDTTDYVDLKQMEVMLDRIDDYGIAEEDIPRVIEENRPDPRMLPWNR